MSDNDDSIKPEDNQEYYSREKTRMILSGIIKHYEYNHVCVSILPDWYWLELYEYFTHE